MMISCKIVRNIISQVGMCFLIIFTLPVIAKNTEGYINVKNGKIYYQTFGSGKPIIVLHGGPGLDQTYLLPQMLELDQSHAVTFYDQRGSGKSTDTKIDDETISVKQFVEDLEAVRKNLGYEKFALIGHSWGGLLAMEYAVAYQKHLSALILMDSAPATQIGFSAFIAQYNKSISPIKGVLDGLRNSPEFARGETATVAEYYRILFTKYLVKPKQAYEISLNFTPESNINGAKVAAIIDKNFLSTNYNIIPQLKSIKVPTLIIHGNHDLVPLWTAKEIKKAIPKSNLVIINAASHFPYIEQPKVTFNSINKFLLKVGA